MLAEVMHIQRGYQASRMWGTTLRDDHAVRTPVYDGLKQ